MEYLPFLCSLSTCFTTACWVSNFCGQTPHLNTDGRSPGFLSAAGLDFTGSRCFLGDNLS